MNMMKYTGPDTKIGLKNGHVYLIMEYRGMNFIISNVSPKPTQVDSKHLEPWGEQSQEPSHLSRFLKLWEDMGIPVDIAECKSGDTLNGGIQIYVETKATVKLANQKITMVFHDGSYIGATNG